MRGKVCHTKPPLSAWIRKKHLRKQVLLGVMKHRYAI